jgi:hypothetical protein
LWRGAGVEPSVGDGGDDDDDQDLQERRRVALGSSLRHEPIDTRVGPVPRRWTRVAIHTRGIRGTSRFRRCAAAANGAPDATQPGLGHRGILVGEPFRLGQGHPEGPDARENPDGVVALLSRGHAVQLRKELLPVAPAMLRRQRQRGGVDYYADPPSGLARLAGPLGLQAVMTPRLGSQPGRPSRGGGAGQRGPSQGEAVGGELVVVAGQAGG